MIMKWPMCSTCARNVGSVQRICAVRGAARRSALDSNNGTMATRDFSAPPASVSKNIATSAFAADLVSAMISLLNMQGYLHTTRSRAKTRAAISSPPRAAVSSGMPVGNAFTFCINATSLIFALTISACSWGVTTSSRKPGLSTTPPAFSKAAKVPMRSSLLWRTSIFARYIPKFVSFARILLTSALAGRVFRNSWKADVTSSSAWFKSFSFATRASLSGVGSNNAVRSQVYLCRTFLRKTWTKSSRIAAVTLGLPSPSPGPQTLMSSTVSGTVTDL
mmetsp:Transcript_55614/g.120075  ORF Transcript_55614/g.120075 Transcript_55614/m.120075 type:complete len:277 (-) Transcript_55614:751-1581(-)